MPASSTSLTITGRLVKTARRQRSAAELFLAYAVWGLGVILLDPLGDIIGGSGTVHVTLFLVIYALLIQLPLLIYYDKALGFTASPATKWRFFGARLFHPVLVYGLFTVLWIWWIGLVIGIWGPLATGSSGLGPLVEFVILVILGLLVLIAYLPIIMLAVLLLKWGQWGGHHLFRIFQSVIRGEKTPPEPDDCESSHQEPRGKGVHDHDEAIKPPTNGVDTSSEQNVRFATLLGLVTLPIGAGWFAGEPEAGISIASLLLAIYEISYKPQEAG